MTTYQNRTPASIKAELESYSEGNCIQLAKCLQDLIANEHNGRDFLALAQRTELKPHERIRVMLASAYEWFAFGS